MVTRVTFPCSMVRHHDLREERVYLALQFQKSLSVIGRYRNRPGRHGGRSRKLTDLICISTQETEEEDGKWG